MRLHLSKEDTNELIKLIVRGGGEVVATELTSGIDIAVKDIYKNRTFIKTLQEETKWNIRFTDTKMIL